MVKKKKPIKSSRHPPRHENRPADAPIAKDRPEDAKLPEGMSAGAGEASEPRRAAQGQTGATGDPSDAPGRAGERTPASPGPKGAAPSDKAVAAAAPARAVPQKSPQSLALAKRKAALKAGASSVAVAATKLKKPSKGDKPNEPERPSQAPDAAAALRAPATPAPASKDGRTPSPGGSAAPEKGPPASARSRSPEAPPKADAASADRPQPGGSGVAAAAPSTDEERPAASAGEERDTSPAQAAPTPLLAVSEPFQDFAAEAQRMARESFEETAALLGRMRGATNPVEIVLLQTSYMQHSMRMCTELAQHLGLLMAVSQTTLMKQSQATIESLGSITRKP